MAKYIIRKERFADVDMFKIKHDINGNPRFAVWFAHIAPSRDVAHRVGLEVGFTKCMNKQLDGYLVVQAYTPKDVYDRVQQARKLTL